MFDWLKKQFTRDKAPGVQTMADLFSRDVMPKKMSDYFEPTPEVRPRDFVRELPGAVGNVAKEIAQGTARSFDYLGRKIAPNLLPGYEPKKGSSPTMEQFLFGGAEKRGDTLRDVASTEWGLNKESMFAPLVGGITVGLDTLPGGKGTKAWIKAIAKSENVDEIFSILKSIAPEADESALRNVADTLRDVKKEKEVTDIVNTLVPQSARTKAPGATQKPETKKPAVEPQKKEAPTLVRSDIQEPQTVGKMFEPETKAPTKKTTTPRVNDEELAQFAMDEEWEGFAEAGGNLDDLKRIMFDNNKGDTIEGVIGTRLYEMTKGYQGGNNAGEASRIVDTLKKEDPAFYKRVQDRTAQSGTPLFNQSPVEGFIQEQLDYLYPPDLTKILKKPNPGAYAVAPVAGLETDEEGNITGFDPLKATMGMAAVGAVKSQKGGEVFEGLQGLSTKVLERLKGRTVVSSGFISDLLRSNDVTKAEREALTEVLLAQGDKVSVKQFAEEVQAQLLPLVRRDLAESSQQGIKKLEELGYEYDWDMDGSVFLSKDGEGVEYDSLPQNIRDLYDDIAIGFYDGSEVGSYKYQNVALPRDKRGNVQKYSEVIYRSPIKTRAGDVHFSNVDNYFAHTRTEDLAGEPTRRVIELQSDLFQKGRLERELPQPPTRTPERTKEILEVGVPEVRAMLERKDPATNHIAEIADEWELSDTEFRYKIMRGEYKEALDDFLLDESFWKKKLQEAIKEKEAYDKTFPVRSKEVEPLNQYAQTWWKRIVREEVQKAVDDGMDTLQFPTGRTAMMVEGLANDFAARRFEADGDYVTLEVLKVGKVIYDSPADMELVITSVSGDGRFKAVDKRKLDFYLDDLIGDGEIKTREEGFMDALLSADDAGISESFSLTGEVDSNNPIFKFYESDIGKYLKARYNATPVTDNRGIQWFQVDTYNIPKGAPVEAYAVAPIAGIETDDEGNVTGFDPLKAALGFAVVGGVQRARGRGAAQDAVTKGEKELTTTLSPRRMEQVYKLSLQEDDIARILGAQKRGKVPHTQLLEEAAQMDASITKLINLPKGTVLPSKQTEAYKQAIAGYREYTKLLRENFLAKPQDILIKKHYDDARATLSKAYANLEALYSEAGRVVESSKVEAITRNPTINVNIDKVRRTLPPEAQVKFDMDLDALDLNNPSEVMDFLISTQDTSWMRKITEYYRASLLSAVTTNAVNAMGNLMSTIADIPIRATAGAFSGVKTALTGAPREVYMTEAWKLLSTGLKSTGDATTHAFRSLLDENYALQFNRSLIESGTQVPAIKGTKGKIIRLPYRLLQAMDMFFRTVKTNSETEALLFRKASQEGLTGQALMVRIEELRRHVPTDILDQVAERADRSLYLEEVTGFLKDVEGLKNRHPWTQMVVPFYRTLVNLMREAYRLTPARMLSKDQWITSKDTRMEEIARMSLGTLAGITMTGAIMDGRLEVTGAAPTDKKQRDTFYGTGKIPYAIRVGDKWIPYQRVQPFSTILFAASKVADIWNFHKETGDMNPADVADAANLLGSEISQFLINQAPLQGIASFLEFLEGGKYNQGTIPAAEDFFAQMLGGFVPNILFSGVRAMDPTMYIADGFKEEIQKESLACKTT